MRPTGRPRRCRGWQGATALAAGLITGAVPSGCAPGAANPSFPVTVSDAGAIVRQMRAEPKAPARPVVVIGGLFDPGPVTGDLCDRVRAMLGPDPPVIGVNLLAAGTMEACRERVVRRVEEAFPSNDPECTTEVDVVGFSLGGVVARDAALERGAAGGGKRLRIARLFTISSPHAGAAAAGGPALDPRVTAVRAGSDFLRSLEAAEGDRGYPIYAYVRLGDALVGERNAAPAGAAPFWVPNRAFEFAHGDAYRDPRILADIGRRLRGEEPLSREPDARHSDEEGG